MNKNVHSKQEIINNSNEVQNINSSDHINLLNFDQILRVLKSQSDTEKANYLMREIRNRISKKKYYKLKNITLYSIMYYDIFGIRNENNNSISNLLKNEEYLIPYNRTSLEAMKLLNAIANEKVGRSYLLMKNQLVEEIVKIMMKEEGDTEKRQCSLGIIQKFTLRSEPQKHLIDLDVIMWITSILISVSAFKFRS